MTTAEELRIVRRAIEDLGPNSYCGPWLAWVLPELESDLRSDKLPTVTPKAAKIEAALIISQAKAEAAAILAKARQARSDLVLDINAALRHLEEGEELLQKLRDLRDAQKK